MPESSLQKYLMSTSLILVRLILKQRIENQRNFTLDKGVIHEHCTKTTEYVEK